MIQFTGCDGKRKTMRVGKMTMRHAETVRSRVEHLVSASLMKGAPDTETARWVASIDDALHDKLAAVGLVEPRQSGLLGSFVDEYIAKRTDVKASTLIVWGNARRNLIEFFGERKPLRDITPGDADDWRLFLLGQGLAENTINKRCSVAKQIFRSAVRRKLIADNPFADLASVVGANRDRLYFVSVDEAQKVLAACPDHEWRLLFALARFGGLRTPSESLALRWGDVDWEKDRVTVPSPKTEHRPGGAWRVMPLFPELRPYLEDAFERAEPGAEFVVTRYRDAGVNLRSQLMKIIRRAGLKAWPRLWHNLRASRETELAESFPAHVICEWIGNSQRVAAKHYLQVTDDDYRRAADLDVTAPERALQKALQPAAAQHGMEPGSEGSTRAKNDETPDGDGGLRQCAALSGEGSKAQGGPDWSGIETDKILRGNGLRSPAQTGAAQCGAVTNEAYLRARWPDAKPGILTAVLGLLEG